MRLPADLPGVRGVTNRWNPLNRVSAAVVAANVILAVLTLPQLDIAVDRDKAAGMRAIVALWGYRLAEDDPQAWGGDVLVDDPRRLHHADAWPSPP